MKVKNKAQVSCARHVKVCRSDYRTAYFLLLSKRECSKAYGRNIMDKLDNNNSRFYSPFLEKDEMELKNCYYFT
jgi:hypothetical protein